MTTSVLFIQGAGAGAHSEDAQLAASLKRELDPEYDVHFPHMPDESNPALAPWKQKISSELLHLSREVVVVAHSIGGSILLNYLSEERVERSSAGLFLLAAPSWDEDHWNFDDLKLPSDIASKLSRIPRIFLYQCRDDEVVPFAHLALHAARIPQAVICALDNGGHQFVHGLTRVASDIRGDAA